MHLQVSFPVCASPVAAGQMLADPVFVRACVIATGGEVLHVDVTDHPDGGFVVTTRRALATDLIPTQFRAFVGDRLEIRQAEVWDVADSDGSRHGTIAVEILGAPVRMTGTTALLATAEGSTVVYAGELKASLPLFGSTVEQAAARAIQGAIEAQESVARQWIVENPDH